MLKPLKLSSIICIAVMFTFTLSFSVLQACTVIPKKSCCEEAGKYDTAEYKEARVIQVSCTVCEDVDKHPKTKDVTLNIKGMTCAGCEGKVKKALSACKGVSDVKVSHKEGKAELHLEEGKANIGDLVEALKDAGFKASS
jgi:copper chaperone CopZ